MATTLAQMASGLPSIPIVCSQHPRQVSPSFSAAPGLASASVQQVWELSGTSDDHHR